MSGFPASGKRTSSASAEAARLQQLGYSLRVNRKCLCSTHHPQRDTQFRHISRLRQLCAEHGIPIPSIDTKKKEQVGRFHHPGAAWNREAVKVHDHDFPSLAEGTAVPCGVYDLQANWGTVYVGSSADTPAFAVECATAWWRDEGRSRYPEAGELVILAGGGSNGYRPRAWKHNLQHVLCDPYAIGVTVAHYPSGCSKWNPIEHRRFSEISRNWAGRPLDSYETILNYLATTSTFTGLRVKAVQVTDEYAEGIRITKQQMSQLRWQPLDPVPAWNYPIRAAAGAPKKPDLAALLATFEE